MTDGSCGRLQNRVRRYNDEWCYGKQHHRVDVCTVTTRHKYRTTTRQPWQWTRRGVASEPRPYLPEVFTSPLELPDRVLLVDLFLEDGFLGFSATAGFLLETSPSPPPPPPPPPLVAVVGAAVAVVSAEVLPGFALELLSSGGSLSDWLLDSSPAASSAAALRSMASVWWWRRRYVSEVAIVVGRAVLGVGVS